MAGCRSFLLVFGAVLLLCAAATAAIAAADDAASNGAYLGSRLLPPTSRHACASGGDPMYRADAIVTGTDMRQRPWGFAQTLREVLVKSSGDPRLATDPRAAQLAKAADRYVACFEYADLMAGTPLHDDQGTYDRPHRLTVLFDLAKINRLLVQLGDRPWHGARPVVVPVLLVHGPKPPPYVLTAETPLGADQRTAVATAAAQFGMSVRLPTLDWLRGRHAAEDRLPEAAMPSRHEALVVGTLDWREALPGWIGQWRMRWRGRDYAWGISGVNYDAAFRNIVRGVMLVASGAGPPDAGD